MSTIGNSFSSLIYSDETLTGLQNSFVPIGTVFPRFDDYLPAGYIRWGEGGSYDPLVYTEFATWMATYWPALTSGDLPDFQGRVPRTVGGLGPAGAGDSQEDALQEFIVQYGNRGSADGTPLASHASGAYKIPWSTSSGGTSTQSDFTVRTSADGPSPRMTTETRVKSIGVRWIIKVYGALVNQGTVDLDTIATAQSYTVRHDSQTLTTAQKGQAKANIGVERSQFDNKVIDGNFDFWNQATSQTSSGYGSSDIWYHGNTGSTKTASRQAFTLGQTDVPGNPEYYCRTVVSSVAGAGNFALQSQNIEDVETLSGKTATLTFWAKADSAKNIAFELQQYFGSGGSPSATVNEIGAQLFALTTSWQKFSVAISVPTVSGKTIGSNNNDYLGVYFWFDAGATWAARSSSLGQQSGTFEIARVSLVEGDATAEDDPFPAYDKGIELTRVQRYYQLGTTYFNAYVTSGNGYYAVTNLRVVMRATPSVTYTNIGNGGFPASGSPYLNSSSRVGETRVASATASSGIFASNFNADARI